MPTYKFQEIFPEGDGDARTIRLDNIRRFQEFTARLTGEAIDIETLTPEIESAAHFYVEMVFLGARLATRLTGDDIEGYVGSITGRGALAPIYSTFVRTIVGATGIGMTPPSKVTNEMAKPIIGRLAAAAYLVLDMEPADGYTLPNLAATSAS